MRLAVLLLTAAAAPAADPFDAKKFALDFQAARAKAINEAKTVPGEQPPFAALRPLIETGWTAAAPGSAEAKAVRRASP